MNKEDYKLNMMMGTYRNLLLSETSIEQKNIEEANMYCVVAREMHKSLTDTAKSIVLKKLNDLEKNLGFEETK